MVNCNHVGPLYKMGGSKSNHGHARAGAGPYTAARVVVLPVRSPKTTAQRSRGQYERTASTITPRHVRSPPHHNDPLSPRRKQWSRKIPPHHQGQDPEDLRRRYGRLERNPGRGTLGLPDTARHAIVRLRSNLDGYHGSESTEGFRGLKRDRWGTACAGQGLSRRPEPTLNSIYGAEHKTSVS